MSVGWIVVSFFSMSATFSSKTQARMRADSLGSIDCRLWHGRDRFCSAHERGALFLGCDSRPARTRGVCILDHGLVRNNTQSPRIKTLHLQVQLAGPGSGHHRNYLWTG